MEGLLRYALCKESAVDSGTAHGRRNYSRLVRCLVEWGWSSCGGIKSCPMLIETVCLTLERAAGALVHSVFYNRLFPLIFRFKHPILHLLI